MSAKRLCPAIGLGLFAAVAVMPQAQAEPSPAPETYRIWPGAAPGTEDWKVTEMEYRVPGQGAGSKLVKGVVNVTVPTLTVFRPAPGKASGVAMIVCPGGGFQGLAVEHEGSDVAQWLAARGITAFVLKYRVRPSPSFRMPADIRHHPENFDTFVLSLEPGRRIAVADGTQALRYLRANAAKFGIVPDRIGMMGFSAGAMTTMGVVMNDEPGERPNFAAPIYGTMEGKAPSRDAPPLFIVAAQDDNAVPVTQSLKIFSAWTAADRSAELHIYERGGHGFGALTTHATVDGWMDAFDNWLRSHGWIAAK